MSDKNTSAPRPGLIRRLWGALWSPAAAISLGVLLIVGFAGGVIFWGGFHTVLEMTNSEKFCTSCHEMRDNVFAEYQGSVHQNNASGVRATCPDCHVPKEWGPKIIRKIRASKELYGHFITQSIWTREKFVDRRIELAQHEWERMKLTDSRECRNCHSFQYMDFTLQENRAGESHQKALDEGKTCIDCHQGIAHSLPDNYLEAYRGLVSRLEAEGAISPQASSSDSAAISSYLKQSN